MRGENGRVRLLGFKNIYIYIYIYINYTDIDWSGQVFFSSSFFFILFLSVGPRLLLSGVRDIFLPGYSQVFFR